MAVAYTNNATTTLSATITDSVTSLSVASGAGAKFPSTGGGDHFYITLTNGAGDIEIMKVTARSTDTFTVVRAQDGTTAQGWSAGDKIELRLTRIMLDDLKGERQPIDADLTAIAGLAGTSGLLRKTAANTWSLDTNTYGTYTVSATAPTSPQNGDRWFDTDNGVELVYINDGNTSQWVDVSVGASASPVGATLYLHANFGGF